MGGGGGAPTQTTTNTSNLPEYARPYFERMMGRAETESNQPYVAYTAPRLAGLTADTQSGYGIARSVATRGLPEFDTAGTAASGAILAGRPDITSSRELTLGASSRGAQQMGQARDVALGADDRGFSDIAAARQLALETADQPGMQQARSAILSADSQGAADINAARSLTTRAVGRGEFETEEARSLAELAALRGLDAGYYSSMPIRQEAFGGTQARQYMSPYMDEVVARQKASTVRDFDEGRPARETEAIRSGAFGGYRSAIREGVAQRGLGERLSDIEAAGRQKAFENAQLQFERDRAASIQAQAQTEAQRLQAAQFGLTGAGMGLQGAQTLGQLTAAQQAAGMQAARDFGQLGGAEREAALRQAGLLSELAAKEQGLGYQGVEALSKLGTSQQALGVQQADLLSRMAAQQQGLDYQGAEALARLGAGQQAAALQQAGTLGDLGAKRQAAAMQQSQALQVQGAAQQEQAQRGFDLAYEDFLRQREAKKQDINFLSSILRGTPVQPTQVRSVYDNPNPLAQFGGLGIAGLGLLRGQ